MCTALKKNVHVHGDSDFIDEDTPMCEPCSVAGDCVPAFRFCSDCQEHLCQKCSNYHVSQKLMRNHKLLTLEGIDTENVSSSSNIPTIPAPSRQAGQTEPADTRSTTTNVKIEPASRGRPSSIAPATLSQGDKYLKDMAARMKKGDRVRRGRDWGKTDRILGGVGGGDEDGEGLGTVVLDNWYNQWSVRWDCGGEEHWYRMGGRYGDIYELQIVEH